VFQQSDDVGGQQQRLTSNVEVNGGQRPRPELRRTAEQRLSARLCRQIKQDDRSVAGRTDQLILHIHRPVRHHAHCTILSNYSCKLLR